MNISMVKTSALPFSSPDASEFEARVHARNIQRLLGAVQELSFASSLVEIQRIVRIVARELTGSDGATFVLNEGDGAFCYYADEDAIAPLWKGKRFPQEICISGWAMRHKQPVIIPDIYADDRIPADAYRPTFVKSLVMVPIRTIAPVGAIGNYWATRHEATEQEVHLLQALADATSLAMETVRVRQEAEDQRSDISVLAEEKAAIEKRYVTDELTGLYNRRGFFENAHKAAEAAGAVQILFVDLDGLKVVNDTQGHAAGDVLISRAAEVMRAVAHPGDVLGRLGGDEFCMLVRAPSETAWQLKDRIVAAIAASNAAMPDAFPLSFSVGIAEGRGNQDTGIAELVASADQAMYEHKRVRRMQRA